jgi:hypothetical protein
MNKRIIVLLVIGATITFAAWIPQQIVPTTPSGKRIKDGGALVTLGDTIYALQGGNSVNFFAYNPNQGTWAKRCSILYRFKINSQGDTIYIKKRVNTGGALVACGNLIYAFKGGSTREFWAYNPSTNTWAEKCSIAAGIAHARVRGGAALTTLDGVIYAFKGGFTNEFWMYDTNTNNWTQKASLITPTKKIGNGAALVCYNGKIYSFTGGNTNYFYSYTPDVWVTEPVAKFGPDSIRRGKQIKDGAALTVLNDKIYAFKGGNTQSFGYYDPAVNGWFTLDTIPKGHSRRGVRQGGSLTTYNGLIYALKGNYTREFWSYFP